MTYFLQLYQTHQTIIFNWITVKWPFDSNSKDQDLIVDQSEPLLRALPIEDNYEVSHSKVGFDMDEGLTCNLIVEDLVDVVNGLILNKFKVDVSLITIDLMHIKLAMMIMLRIQINGVDWDNKVDTQAIKCLRKRMVHTL